MAIINFNIDLIGCEYPQAHLTGDLKGFTDPKWTGFFRDRLSDADIFPMQAEALMLSG